MRLVLLSFLLTTTCFGQPDCSLELDKDSIRIFTCIRHDSRYKTVKALFTLNSTMPQFKAALLDIDNYGAWQYRTSSVKVIEKLSDTEVVYHTEVEAPAMTNNRDFVIRLTLDEDRSTGTLIAHAVSMPDYIPVVEDVVRVPFSHARWSVVPRAKGKLEVEYTIDIDLGGSVPVWLVNMLAPKAPYETFKALRETIGKYAESPPTGNR